MNPEVARKTWRTLEPYHAMVYFAPEAQEEYLALGLDASQNRAIGYFPARAAAMGAVTWQTVQATFFNFSALACQFGMSGVWTITSPEQVVAARLRGADRALQRMCGDLLDRTLDDTKEAADLARAAAAACTPYGRPLYAAHAGLDWPEPEHLQLWHATTLLREYRGDGHIAALVAAGLTGLEAAVLHVAMNDTWARKALQATRAYSDEEWDAAAASLSERGWLDGEGAFTDEGRSRREAIEKQTDELAMAPWERIGEDGAARLRELVRPLSQAISQSGAFGRSGPKL
ncbi:MAG: hypothetical protein JWL79_1150 [Frankiales bacterium]|jgi:hypothetical protein|nr:hypothetical protein [Frankiales bacterium]